MKSATQSRFNRYPQPTTDQTFHSREASLGDNDHVTAAIGDLYGGSDEEHHDADSQYHRHHQRRPPQQSQSQSQQQPSIRYHHPHSSQTLPVTPPQTPTKSRKSPGGSSNQPRTPPHMDNTSPSSLPSSSTLRVPGNSPNANQAFPLNNIDYESNPDAVQQELENLQALRRLSMDVSSVANDPDLPSFNNFFPSVAPKGRADDDDAARLFWVPARLHPELAPKAFKNFVESRVEQIREHEGTTTTDGLQAGPSLRRKKSMLSRQIDTEGKAAEGYEDGADILRRNRSNSEGEQVLTVSELGEVLAKKDPVDLVRQMSLSKAEKALMGEPGQDEDDQPIFAAPPPGGSLRRSTRTALRRGSIRKGERVAPSSRRAKLAAAGDGKPGDEPEFKLSRVRTEPIPSISISSEDEETRPQSSSSRQPEMTMKARSRQPVSPVSPISPEEPKRQVTAPPGLSQRPTSPPERLSSERMARSKSEPESPSPPPREPIPPIPPQPVVKIDRKEAPPSSSQRIAKEPRGAPPNGQLPPAPAPPPPVTSESSSKQKRPALKRGSPGTSSYEPTKDAAPSPSPPAPPTQPPAEAKRKELSAHSGQQVPPKEVGRKSSWSWLSLGSDGDKGKDGEREREKESGSRKVRKAKSMEKDRDRDDEKERKREIKREKEREREMERDKERSSDREHARLDLLQKSIDGPKKRESLDGNSARPSMDSLERERDKEKEKASRKASSSDKEKEKKEPGIFSSIFGGSKKKQEETKSKSKGSNLAVPSGRSKSPPTQPYYYTRFPIHIERAIYRLSHLKLANPRRPLLQQVLLSNFMYAYLAKVQQMQPPNAVQGSQQQQQQQQAQQQQAQQAQQYQQQQLEQQYLQQQQQGGAQVNGDDSQQLDSDEEDYDFDDDGRDDRPYDSQQGYNTRTASREASNSNGVVYQQDYDGGGYGYQGHEQQYQQDQQVYYQQSGGVNGHPGDGGYHDHDKDYDYYQDNDHDGYDRRGGDSRGYEGGNVSGNRYHHQQSMNDDRDRDYADEMW